MSNKNKTQHELDMQAKKRKHRQNNQKNPTKFKGLKRRRHGVGRLRK